MQTAPNATLVFPAPRETSILNIEAAPCYTQVASVVYAKKTCGRSHLIRTSDIIQQNQH